METSQSENEMELNSDTEINTQYETVPEKVIEMLKQYENNSELLQNTQNELLTDQSLVIDEDGLPVTDKSSDGEFLNEQELEDQNRINYYNDHLRKQKSETILTSGIGRNDTIIHFGAGDDDGSLLRFILNVESNQKGVLNNTYIAIEPDAKKVDIIESLKKTFIEENKETNVNISIYSETIQTYLDENPKQTIGIADWIVISDLFSKPIYEQKQMEFFHKTLIECWDLINRGVIVSFNNRKTTTDEYDIRHIISYIQINFNRFRIERLDEDNYIMTLYKFFIPHN